jgi:hypothetical protein
MTILGEEHIDEFIERFHSFNDGVIRTILVSYRNSSAGAEAQLGISVRDSASHDNDSWVNVRIKASDVTEFSFHETDKESYQVLSSGLHVTWIDGVFFLEFGDCIDISEEVSEIRKSKFYLAAKLIEWEVAPYQE